MNRKIHLDKFFLLISQGSTPSGKPIQREIYRISLIHQTKNSLLLKLIPVQIMLQQQQPPPPQWPSEIQKERLGCNCHDRWMYQPWQHGLMALPPASPYHGLLSESDLSSDMYVGVGRLSGRRRSAEYPNRARYTFPDRPVGLARHSADFPEQHAMDGGTTMDMVPGYMAPTQSAKAKVVRGQGSGSGSVKFGGGTPVYQEPKSPSSKLVNPFHLLQSDWPTGSSPDLIGVVDQTPPRGLRRRRIDFG